MRLYGGLLFNTEKESKIYILIKTVDPDIPEM